MSERFDQEQIREHWTQQALKHGQSAAASWSDLMVMDMEIREILKYLIDGDKVLDIGCANGYSTVQFAAEKRVDIRGLDLIPEMIDQARERVAGIAQKLAGSAGFHVGNITRLDEADASYDKAIVIRVIINLADWHHQLIGLRECARVLKPGGLLLLSEATFQGWNRLNKLRKEWGLPDIPMPPFNLYLDQDQVIDAVSDSLEMVDLTDFASTYYVGTRVLKPLLAKALGLGLDVSNPLMEWNRWFSVMPSWGDYGTQKLFVFRKK